MILVYFRVESAERIILTRENVKKGLSPGGEIRLYSFMDG